MSKIARCKEKAIEAVREYESELLKEILLNSTELRIKFQKLYENGFDNTIGIYLSDYKAESKVDALVLDRTFMGMDREIIVNFIQILEIMPEYITIQSVCGWIIAVEKLEKTNNNYVAKLRCYTEFRAIEILSREYIYITQFLSEF